jgi:hypothetical protein
MSALALFFLVLGLGLIAWLSARMRAARFRVGNTARFSSLPAHHGWYVALWTAIPPLLFLVGWSMVAPALVTDTVLASPAAVQLPPPGFDRASILSEARSLAEGRSFGAFHELARASCRRSMPPRSRATTGSRPRSRCCSPLPAARSRSCACGRASARGRGSSGS